MRGHKKWEETAIRNSSLLGEKYWWLNRMWWQQKWREVDKFQNRNTTCEGVKETGRGRDWVEMHLQQRLSWGDTWSLTGLSQVASLETRWPGAYTTALISHCMWAASKKGHSAGIPLRERAIHRGRQSSLWTVSHQHFQQLGCKYPVLRRGSWHYSRASTTTLSHFPHRSGLTLCGSLNLQERKSRLDTWQILYLLISLLLCLPQRYCW